MSKIYMVSLCVHMTGMITAKLIQRIPIERSALWLRNVTL